MLNSSVKMIFRFVHLAAICPAVIFSWPEAPEPFHTKIFFPESRTNTSPWFMEDQAIATLSMKTIDCSVQTVLQLLPLSSQVSSLQQPWKALPREHLFLPSAGPIPSLLSWSSSHRGTDPWSVSANMKMVLMSHAMKTNRFEALNFAMLNGKTTKEVVQFYSLCYTTLRL